MWFCGEGDYTLINLPPLPPPRPPPPFTHHLQPPAAPTSRNYAEMREKLRLRLTRRKEEQPKREEPPPVAERDMGVEDHRRVEDLLQFINSADNKPASSSKAAQRARHKQKKVRRRPLTPPSPS